MKPKSLKASYEQLRRNHTNRSSAIFPFVCSSKNDTILCFLDYWSLKNRLSNYTLNIRVYDELGDLLVTRLDIKLENHNQFSVRDHLMDPVARGMVEIEIISLDNMGYPFPAVTCFYSSGVLLSAVHSAGRILNPSEASQSHSSCETNWYCKWTGDVTPFFVLINGPLFLRHRTTIVRLCRDGVSLGEVPINETEVRAFSTRFFFVKDFEQLMSLCPVDGDYLEVEVECNGVFPRLVVGNYFPDVNFFEVTHSFRRQDGSDMLPPSSDPDFVPSLGPFPLDDRFDSELVFFPTNGHQNCSGDVVRWCRQSRDWHLDEQPLSLIESGRKNSTRVVRPSAVFGNADAGLVRFYHGDIPTRINTSYRYAMKGTSFKYSTDIAAGQVCTFTPNKRFTWGHGVFSSSHSNRVWIFNLEFNKKQSARTHGIFTLYFGGMCKPLETEISIDSFKLIDVEELCISKEIDIDRAEDAITTFSWSYRQLDGAMIYAYWLTLTPAGNVVGDHAF